MVLCEVTSALSSARICECQLPHDATVESIKQEIAPEMNTPTELLQIIIDDRTMLNGQHQPFLHTTDEAVSVQVVMMTLETVCTRPEDVCSVLDKLRGLGSEALMANVHAIASLLKNLPVPAKPVNQIGAWFYTLPMLDYKAHISLCDTLTHLGPSCLPVAAEVAAAFPVLISETVAGSTIERLMYYSTRRIKGSPIETDWINFHHCENPMINKLSSVFLSLGYEGLNAIMDSFVETFEDACDSVKGLALLCIARAMRPSSQNYLHHADTLATALNKPNAALQWCALQCWTHMAKCEDRQQELWPCIPVVLPLLRRQDHIDDAAQRRCVLSAACGFLSSCGDLREHIDSIVAAFLTQFTEAEATAEIERFEHCVRQKAHGAYMFFMKLRAATATSFSLLFGHTGTGLGCVVQQCFDALRDALPCQKAVFLLCAARSMPTCTKVDAQACASLLSDFLLSPSWQLRACAIHGMQRLIAGYMGPEPHADKIAALLHDDVPFVRQSAAAALGCLGGKAVRYRNALLALLNDGCSHVRYASLITLGGLMKKARPFDRAIAAHLTDTDPRCRMAALRALKCMGKKAESVIPELKAWQQQWYSQSPHDEGVKKLEPITTRALMFPHAPLKHIFKGHAPLGKRFTGAKTVRESRRQEYVSKIEQHEQQRWKDRWHKEDSACEECTFNGESFDAREARAYHRSVQEKHRAIDRNRRRQKKEELTQRRLARLEGSTSSIIEARHVWARGRSKSSRSFQLTAHMEEWVIPAIGSVQ